jgi:hypothetical protein
MCVCATIPLPPLLLPPLLLLLQVGRIDHAEANPENSLLPGEATLTEMDSYWTEHVHHPSSTAAAVATGAHQPCKPVLEVAWWPSIAKLLRSEVEV